MRNFWFLFGCAFTLAAVMLCIVPGVALAGDLSDPVKVEKYFLIGYAVSSLFTAIAQMTKTEKDDEAARYFSKLIDFLGGNWSAFFKKKS